MYLMWEVMRDDWKIDGHGLCGEIPAQDDDDW